MLEEVPSLISTTISSKSAAVRRVRKEDMSPRPMSRRSGSRPDIWSRAQSRCLTLLAPGNETASVSVENGSDPTQFTAATIEEGSPRSEAGPRIGAVVGRPVPLVSVSQITHKLLFARSAAREHLPDQSFGRDHDRRPAASAPRIGPSGTLRDARRSGRGGGARDFGREARTVGVAVAHRKAVDGEFTGIDDFSSVSGANATGISALPAPHKPASMRTTMSSVPGPA